MSAGLLERRSSWVWAALLAALLASVANLPWTLDDYDQAKQAFTSFEMWDEGRWLYQHTPNGWIATKPPLVGWISAGLYAVTRTWPLAWRLPSWFATLALGFFLARAAARAYGKPAALLALGAFGLNLLTPRLATLVRTDMPLALMIFLCGLTIWEKVRRGSRWTADDRIRLFFFLTAAMLMKGPIVLAFLLPAVVTFQIWKWRHGSPASAWGGWWPWIASLALFLFWVGGGIAFVPGFYEQVVLKEFAGRFGETVHRAQPFYFYLPHLLHRFAPWSLLLPALGLFVWRARLRGRWRPDIVWLLGWSIGGLVVLSAVPSKRLDRIFPILPPLALLLAAAYASLQQKPTLAARARRWSALVLLAAAGLTSGYVAQKVYFGYREDDAVLVRFASAVRETAERQHWRYEVMGGLDEGLLLYLRRTHFLSAGEAVRRWNYGTLDALVLPAKDAPQMLAALPDAMATPLEATIVVNGQQRRYLLLRKRDA